jgi:hypothetical protein
LALPASAFVSQLRTDCVDKPVDCLLPQRASGSLDGVFLRLLKKWAQH